MRGATRARASSRFATLAHAISRTMPQTPSRIWRLRPYSSFISATPAPAGTTLIDLFGKHANDVGHPVGGIAGIVLHPLPQDAGQPWAPCRRWKRQDASGR